MSDDDWGNANIGRKISLRVHTFYFLADNDGGGDEWDARMRAQFMQQDAGGGGAVAAATLAGVRAELFARLSWRRTSRLR
jgi:hypothetical protein